MRRVVSPALSRSLASAPSGAKDWYTKLDADTSHSFRSGHQHIVVHGHGDLRKHGKFL